MLTNIEDNNLQVQIERYAFRFVRRLVNHLNSVDYYKTAGKYIPDLSVDSVQYIAETYSDDDIVVVYNNRVVPTGPRRCICTNVSAKSNSVCTRSICSFAHFIEEWEPESCKFGRKCGKKHKCQRLHGKETSEDALKRIGVTLKPFKKYKKIRHYVIENIDRKRSDEKQKQ